MRTTKTNLLRLWIPGQAQNPVDLDIPLHNLIQYGVEGDINDELNAVAPNPSNYWIDQ